jgi:hypothetical protein
MMALNCSPEVAQEIRFCKNLWRISIRHGRNIKARKTRMSKRRWKGKPLKGVVREGKKY